MYTLKLKNALSYFGAIKADAKNPIIKNVQDDIAMAAVASGYFDIVSHKEDPAKGKGKGKSTGDETPSTAGDNNPVQPEDKQNTEA